MLNISICVIKYLNRKPNNKVFFILSTLGNMTTNYFKRVHGMYYWFPFHLGTKMK